MTKNFLSPLAFFLLLALAACTATPTKTPTPTRVAPTATLPAPIRAPVTATPFVKPWGTRQEISLDGRWEYAEVKSLDDALPTSGWQSFNVPGLLSGYDYERAWFRRKFTAPETWRGQKLLLHFGSVKFNSRVLVNGKNVGGSFNGYDAFDMDISDAVRIGAENELVVGAQDWTGVFSAGAPVNFPPDIDGNALRAVPRDRILAPIGGQFYYYGIWDSVTLHVVPTVYIESIFARPLVSQNRLEVDVTITNAGAQAFAGSLNARIFKWDGAARDDVGQWTLQGNAIASFAPNDVNIAAGKTMTTTIRLNQPPLETWSPYTPRLYVLEVGFSAGDAVRERIGYREFTTRNGDFYLNGKKVHLLATSYWPPTQEIDREYVTTELQAIRAMNAVAFRTHTQPWRRLWYEVADEIGVLMIPEGAVWNDDEVYRVDDQKFWDNYAAHLRAMVRDIRNHPSVVMWSLENEMYGPRAKEGSRSESELAKLSALVKREDPTRPITYESDGDPGGATDVIGIHYPNEFPDKRLWPQDAYWLDTARQNRGGGGMFWNNPTFLWTHQKPLYIGEYLWIPSDSPAANTLFFGDDAYRDYRTYRAQAKATAWRMQMLAYRSFDVSGHSPWTVHEEGPMDERNPTWVAQQDLYRPLAAFTRQMDSRFYAGQTITRTIELFNDTMSDLPQVAFRWTLLDSEVEITDGGETLAMPSGNHQSREIKIAIPSVIASGAKQSPSNLEIASSQSPLLAMTPAHTPLILRLTMNVGSAERFREDIALEVFPREKWSLPNVSLALFDPKGNLAKSLTQQGVAFRSLKQLQDWDAQGVLIAGPDALTKTTAANIPVIGETKSEDWLARQVEQGARVLVIEQDASASDWLPMRLSNQSSTFAFPQIASHPILHGITAADLRWWRGDHIVSRNEPYRLPIGGMSALVVTGNASGIANAPLVEVQQGRGVWLICQLQVANKLDSEPMGRVLFERMINYLSVIASEAKQSPSRDSGIASQTALAMTGTTLYFGDGLPDQLTRLGIDAQLRADWTTLTSSNARLLVLQTDSATIAQNAEKIRAFVNAGGNVLWNRPNASDFAQARDALKLPVTMQPYRGPALRAEGTSDFWQALTREDLYWLGQHEGTAWSETPLATDVADAVFLTDEKIATNTLDARQNVRLEGTSVRAQGNAVAFAANGRATWSVQVPAAGTYQFGIVARGTPVKDVYPMVQVYLDGQRVGTLYVAKKEAAFFSLPIRAPAGQHQIAIAYANDEYAPPEDRNLYVERYALTLIKDAATVEALTVPASLVSVPIGKGRIVLSAIRWDDAGRNATRAQRFIASLLTTLGATSRGRAQVSIIEAEEMTPMPNYRYFARQGDFVTMVTNGYIETQVRVATAGKYRIGVMARGTPAAGVYPMAALELNGKVIGQVECKTDGFNLHYIVTELPAGTFNLRVRFTNDLQSQGEDRNLNVQRLEFELIK